MRVNSCIVAVLHSENYTHSMKTKTLRTWSLLIALSLTLIFFGGDASKILPTELLVWIDAPEKVEASIDSDVLPVTLLAETLQDAMQLQWLLYRNTLNRNVETPLEQAVDMLSWVGVLEDEERILDEAWYSDIIVSRAEAIKQLVLLNTLRTPVIFNELIYHDGYVPYDDMRRDAWYTPYVQYAYEQKRLEWFDREWLLQPLHPLTHKEYARLVKNMWGNDYWKKTNSWYITKEIFIKSAVLSYKEQLFSLRTLYGNNKEIYLTLLSSIKDLTKEEQYTHIENVYNQFNWMQESVSLTQYWVSAQWVVMMLETILQ